MEDMQRGGFAPFMQATPHINKGFALFSSLFGSGMGIKLWDKPQMILGGLGGKRYVRGVRG
jgi:hypothetical protein